MTAQQPYQHPYQYLVLRCVPRADREEFVNVGVAVYCQAVDFLDVAVLVDEVRLRALDPRLDLPQVRAALAFAQQVCRGEGGGAAEQPLGTRFGFLAAPRSTVVRPGPVHGGVTDDPARQLERLLSELVG